MNYDELKNRIKKFALRIIKLTENLPVTNTGKIIGNQLLRSAASIGANYRSACRSGTKIEFISKVRIVEEEADESVYRIELIKESELIRENKINDLLKEAHELTAIFTSTGKTTKQNLKNSKSEIPNCIDVSDK